MKSFLVYGYHPVQVGKGYQRAPRRIEVIHGKRPVSVDIALRSFRYFGLSERFWLNLQARYDLEVEKDRLEKRLENQVKLLSQGKANCLGPGSNFPCHSQSNLISILHGKTYRVGHS